MNTNNVVRAFNTLKEMIDDRGLPNDLHDIDNERFISIISNDTGGMSHVHVNDRIAVLFSVTGKLKVSDTLQYIKDIGKERVIVVSRDKMNTNFVRNLSKSNDTDVVVELFYLKELLFNPYRHELVPKHRILSKEEANDVVTTLKLRAKSQLPIIHHEDPISRHLGIESGDIVCVTRHSRSAGTHNVYRFCV